MMATMMIKHPTKSTKAAAVKIKNPKKKGWVKQPDGTYKHQPLPLKEQLEQTIAAKAKASKAKPAGRTSTKPAPKAAAPVKKQPGVRGAVKYHGVGAFIEALVTKGKDNQEILEALVEEYPNFDLATKKHYPSWYRAAMNRKAKKAKATK